MDENQKLAITKDDLKSFMRKLAILEDQIGSKLEHKKIADEALKKTPEYYIVLANEVELKSLQQEEAELKSDLKHLFLSLAFEAEFADKKPIDGVEIKKFDTVEILDEQAAKIWLATNAPDCLSIKKSETDKVLKVVKTGFSKVGFEYRVQIASDLSKYLPKEE